MFNAFDNDTRRTKKHNPVIWTAIQPALQLVSRFLRCNHPSILSWADVRKLRPVDDARDTLEDPENALKQPEASNAGIDRAYYFSIWPEFSGLEDDLDDLSYSWDDIREICRAGFDTTSYAFDILTATVRWEFSSQWRSGNIGGCTGDGRTNAATGFEINTDGVGPPFYLPIDIASDAVWPLLVDEFSTAEKAAASFSLANTILHELAVSLLGKFVAGAIQTRH